MGQSARPSCRAVMAECPLGLCRRRTVMEKATTQKLRPPNTSRVGLGCLPGGQSATPSSPWTVWESCWNLSMPNPTEAWSRYLEVVLLVVAKHQTAEGAGMRDGAGESDGEVESRSR